MHTVRQLFAGAMPTLGACLRGIGGVHGDHTTTSIFRFVRQARDELPPRRIVDGLSEAVVVDHGVDREVFDGHDAVDIDNLPTLLVGKVRACWQCAHGCASRPSGACGVQASRVAPSPSGVPCSVAVGRGQGRAHRAERSGGWQSVHLSREWQTFQGPRQCRPPDRLRAAARPQPHRRRIRTTCPRWCAARSTS